MMHKSCHIYLEKCVAVVTHPRDLVLCLCLSTLYGSKVITQLEKCLVEIQKEEQEENASDEPYKQLSGTVLPTLERFLYVVKYLFKEDGRHKDDFRMVVTKVQTKTESIVTDTFEMKTRAKKDSFVSN